MDSVFSSVLSSAIAPALALFPDHFRSPEAARMLLAIGMQESRFKFRAQILVGKLKGPARGFWQFEKGGGVAGVMTHFRTMHYAMAICSNRGVRWDETAIHAALETDDVLAAAFARLLLYADPAALPALDAPPDDSWDCYARNWRPGKPHRETWDEIDAAASAHFAL